MVGVENRLEFARKRTLQVSFCRFRVTCRIARVSNGAEDGVYQFKKVSLASPICTNDNVKLIAETKTLILENGEVLTGEFLKIAKFRRHVISVLRQLAEATSVSNFDITYAELFSVTMQFTDSLV